MAEQSQGARHVALGQVNAHQAEEAVRLRGGKYNETSNADHVSKNYVVTVSCYTGVSSCL